MQIISIFICFKSLKSFYYFVNFLNIFLKKFFKNFIIKNFFTKFTKAKISILKSPHVHKNSQEQFYKKFYKKKLVIILLNSIQLKFFVILKKILKFAFYDFVLQIQTFTFKFNFDVVLQKLLNLNYFCLFEKKNCSNFLFLNNTKYLFFFKKVKIYNYIKVLNLLGITLFCY